MFAFVLIGFATVELRATTIGVAILKKFSQLNPQICMPPQVAMRRVIDNRQQNRPRPPNRG